MKRFILITVILLVAAAAPMLPQTQSGQLATRFRRDDARLPLAHDPGRRRRERGAARRDAADSLGGLPRRLRPGGRADREEGQGGCGERVRPHAAGGSRQAGRCPHGEDAARRRFRDGRRERGRPDGVDDRHQEWRSPDLPDAHRCRRQGQRRREGAGSDAVDVGRCGNPQRGRDGEGADREGRHGECARQVHRLAEPDHLRASRAVSRVWRTHPAPVRRSRRLLRLRGSAGGRGCGCESADAGRRHVRSWWRSTTATTASRSC